MASATRARGVRRVSAGSPPSARSSTGTERYPMPQRSARGAPRACVLPDAKRAAASVAAGWCSSAHAPRSRQTTTRWAHARTRGRPRQFAAPCGAALDARSAAPARCAQPIECPRAHARKRRVGEQGRTEPAPGRHPPPARPRPDTLRLPPAGLRARSTPPPAPSARARAALPRSLTRARTRANSTTPPSPSP